MSEQRNVSTEWADWLDSYEGLSAPVAIAAPPEPLPLRWLSEGAVLAPGLLMAGVLAMAAHYAADFLGRTVLGFAKSPIGAASMAVLLGAALRNFVGLPASYEAGLKFWVRVLLRGGIVLLGLRLSLPAAGAIGLQGLPLILCCIGAAIGMVMVLRRVLAISARQAYLIAVGTGVCGVSAISAVAPLLEADDDEVSYAIACVTVFGVVAMFGYPWLAHWLFGGDALRAGFFLGTSIHDTAQVAGAAMMYRQQFDAPGVVDTAVVTKLVRNTSMIVLIPLFGWLAADRGGVRIGQVVPRFVVLYVAMAGVRSVGDAFEIFDRASWQSFLAWSDGLAGWILTAATAAIGLGTELSRVRRLGWRPLAAGLAAAGAVGVVSWGVLGWG
ncbi:MAG: putative sulfate exporter family transporter [Acidobacteria bacterium]|nr:putative sulfate exporter family transporter [Acidobacteriota bacterium]